MILLDYKLKTTDWVGLTPDQKAEILADKLIEIISKINDLIIEVDNLKLRKVTKR